MSSEKNIIKVYFKGTHLTHSKTQYQYNHGMVLHFADLDLPQAFETHFANKQHGNSKTVIGSENKVEIPDEYFWTGANEIFAWVYLHSDVDDGETVYEVRIPLVKRAKPSDEEPLPEQQSAIDRAIAELSHAVETTNADVEQTNADREAVTTLRDEVVDLRDEAEQSAQTATAKANEANESASSASESEQNAHDYADDAKRYAENAFSSKETAVASASDAEQAKEDAEQARDDAQDTKSDAIQIKQDVVGLKDDVANLKDDVIVLKEQTDTNVTHYPKVIDEYWHVWNASLGEYVNTSVKAKGEKGDKGDTYVLTEEDKEDIAGLIEVPLKYVKDDASDNGGVIEGRVTGDYANVASGNTSHAEGDYTKATGDCSHSEGTTTEASGTYSHVEGKQSKSVGEASHAEGYNTISNGKYSHTEGSKTQTSAEGYASHAEGSNTVASGGMSHAEGHTTTASGAYSHSEGRGTVASSFGSHAEGFGSVASGLFSHAETSGQASGDYSHAENTGTASGNYSHAEGYDTTASGYVSHAEGQGTIAKSSRQHVEGKYNIEDTDNTYAHIVGNGASPNNRSNAYTLDWDGNGVYSGKVTVGTAPTNDMDVATKKYVDDVKGASIHICSSEEYDSTTRIPTITNPDERTFYLVPSEGGTSPDLFVEWAYINNAWEMFGSMSIDLSNYVTNTDYATANNGGIVRVNGYGLKINASNGIIQTSGATSGIIKSAIGSDAEYRPVTPLRQHESTFYGLAKASGDETQSASDNAVGTYTDEAKASIQNMLNVPSKNDIINAFKAFPTDTATGAVASFPDGADDFPMKSLVVSINPVQDLHGYDAPWPAGGGKNKFNVFALESKNGMTVNSDGTLTTTKAVCSGKTLAQLAPNLIVGETYKLFVTSTGTGNLYIYLRDIPITWNFRTSKTITQEMLDSEVNFYATTDGVSTTLSNIMIMDSSITDESYMPYENICPITGWTGAHVQRTGKNLLPNLAKQISNSTIMLGQTESYSRSWEIFLPAGTYTVKASLSKSYYLYARNADSSVSERSTFGTEPTFTFTTSKDDYFAFWIYTSQNNADISDIISVQLELGTTATDYEPYTGNTYSVSWESEAGTVYGGTLDVVSGELVVDRASVDMGTLNWLAPISANPNWFRVNNADWRSSIKSKSILCSVYGNVLNNSTSSALNNAPDKSITVNTGNYNTGNHPLGTLLIKDTAYNENVSAFKSAMSGVQLVYELAEPITYHLTPTEVRTMLGQNNVWADMGNSTVEYRADSNLYIQREIPDVPVTDVQINGTSILSNGVANVPIAGSNTLGTVRVISDTYGLKLGSNGNLQISIATSFNCKNGIESFRPVAPNHQHESAFYGLAKAAGDTTQSQSSNAVGTYTESAKSAIHDMLNGSVTVSGTTPTIVAKSGIRYVCGEIASLDFTPPASGICDVVFTSGSTPTVLTVPSTVKWANGFDPSSLDADTTYELNIMDGLGVCGTWT